MKTILVVDDEPEIVALCSDYLRAAGYAVLTRVTGAPRSTDAPNRPGLSCSTSACPRSTGSTSRGPSGGSPRVPIVMLTARAEDSDKLVGLELGADDYITKPFSPKELVARMRAVLRRAEGAHASVEIVRAGDVELDTARMLATVAGRRVELTPTEFRLLLELARQPGRVFTRSQLLVGRPRHRIQVLRASDRRSREEPQTQDRRRSARSTARCRIQYLGVGYRMADEQGG